MRKVQIIHLIGLWLPGLLMAQSVSADAAADLEQAEGFYKAGKYAHAEQVYQRVLQNEPNNPEAVYQAGKMLPQVYLATGQLPQARSINKTAQASQTCRDL